MTDIAITAANVVPGADARTVQGIFGATITQGQQVYLDSADSKWKLADSNSATAAVRQATATALTSGANNQPCVVQKTGDITIGGTLTPGVEYYLSDTPGGICPVADVGSGEYVCRVGIAKSASVLTLDYAYPGVSN